MSDDRSLISRVHPGWWLLGALLVIYPWIASDFFTYQIGGYTLILGLIALSLMILAGYGGMVSLAQITVAGVAAYTLPVFGANSVDVLGLGWPVWVLYPFAILIAALFSTLVGLISVRTEGIYTIMITLAIAVSFFFFARQNYVLFNGFQGFAGVDAPRFFGIYWRDPTPFYYVCLVTAVFFFTATAYGARSTFGLTLQAIRDNPRRMAALGYSVTAHRVYAFFLSGIVAGTAGVLLVLFNGRVSPGTIGVDIAIDILVIAVVGGLRHPIGPFVGALAFVLLENFAIDLIDRERFNTVIGLAFLLVVFFSPDGLIGLWQKAAARFGRKSLDRGANPTGSEISTELAGADNS
ncbi:MAG: branched-chain amino acid ABC transporter permease [Pseudomonadota bacterium]